MRWVSYTRATSCLEENSPAGIIGIQNKSIAEFMKANKWIVDQKYSDRKDSRTETTAFDQMIQDGMQRKFDGIVVCSIFRCGQSVMQAEKSLGETFFPAGIQFAVSEDQFCSIGKTKEEVKSYFCRKTEESKSIKMRSFTERELAHEWIPYHRLCYGYLFSEDHCSWKIDEGNANVVRLIFQLFLNGKTYAEITKELNDEGIPAPGKRKFTQEQVERSESTTPVKWTLCSVRKILLNSTYTGKLTFKKDGEEIVCRVPSIIGEEDFDEVKKMMARISQKRGARILKNQQHKVGPLFKLIYDKKTGLLMRRYENPAVKGEFGYLPNIYKNQLQSVSDQLVPEYRVINAIAHRLRLARQQAWYIDWLIENGEGKKQIEPVISIYRNRAKEIVSEINKTCIDRMKTFEEHQNGGLDNETFAAIEEEYQKRFIDYENEFQRINEDIKVINKAYSRENPWLKLYRNLEIPEEMDHDYLKNWVDAVFVEDMLHIEVKLKNSEWMNRLPKTWLHFGTEGL